MLTKVAALIQSKVALAALGVVLVGGSGTAVAVAVNNNHASSTQSSASSSSDNAHATASQTPNSHAHTVSVVGFLKAYDASAQTISVLPDRATTPTTIAVDANTTVNGANATSLSDLTANVGHKVEVSATKASSGSLLAWKITVTGDTQSGANGKGSGSSNGNQGQGQQRAVTGTITSIGANSFVVTLKDGTTQTVTITATTRFTGSAQSFSALTSKMRVTVQGTEQSGAFVATSVVTEG